MFEKALGLLLIFSLAFNIAFVGIWVSRRPEAPPPEPGPLPVGPGPVGGEERPGDGGPRRGWFPPARLNLTPAQQKATGEAWEQFGSQMRELSESSRAHREELFRLLGQDEVDRAAVEAAQVELERVQEQMGRLVLRHILDTRDKLDPEQRREWLRMMAGHGERLQNRSGLGGGPSGARRAPFGSPRQAGRRERQRPAGDGPRPEGPPPGPAEEGWQ